MNHFVFHNVGQGLFYSGHIDNNHFNFVYDCGTSSAQKYIENAVDNQLPSQDIDFVVISHLHKDHISGLKRLVDNYNVKKIYLPYLGKGNLSLIKLLCAVASIPDGISGQVASDGEDREIFYNQYHFLISLYDGGRRNNRIQEIVYLGNDEEQNSENKYSYYDEKLQYSSVDDIQWVFAFLNRRQSRSHLKDLNHKIDGLLKGSSYESVDEAIINNDLQKIVGIYESVFGKRKQNLTSTVLIHYPISKMHFISNFDFVFHRHFSQTFPRSVVSILTGDAEFDDVLLSKMDMHLQLNGNAFSVFQAPHHGSKKNWDLLTNSYKLIFNQYVIPCGIGRKKHPSISVIKELSLLKTNCVHFANELSQYIYYIV